ncbi:hypothetical protein FGO68_gene907 [Halteria grandinella]|uniref:Phosducin domain-containing protein n=1 Tax=Halteria grandinella TaxID=5974 RepID=A0A8J8NJB3_HALGN|nr:hypothetical protein FGO68_gene907 [Halteria grandinella]
MGNWLPRPPVPTTEEINQEQLDRVEAVEEFKGRTKEQLERMQEAQPDLEDDDEFLEVYRAKRLQELQKDVGKPRFGSQIEISRNEWEVQVTRAPPDAVVVITLYQMYNAESVRLVEILDKVAQKHPFTKFIKMIATKCIENYLDIDVPGVLFYKNGDLVDKIIPAGPVFGGGLMNIDTVEFVLAMKKVIDAEFEEDPRTSQKEKSRKKNDESDSDEDPRDDREYLNNQMFRYKH